VQRRAISGGGWELRSPGKRRNGELLYRARRFLARAFGAPQATPRGALHRGYRATPAGTAQHPLYYVCRARADQPIAAEQDAQVRLRKSRNLTPSAKFEPKAFWLLVMKRIRTSKRFQLQELKPNRAVLLVLSNTISDRFSLSRRLCRNPSSTLLSISRSLKSTHP
jgi:hypothetical protein